MKRFFAIAMLMAAVAGGCSRYVKSVTSAREHAKVVAAKALLSTVGQALEMYQCDMGMYPTEAQGLDALVKKPAFEDEQLSEHWRGPYLDNVPKDPWGHPLVYSPPGQESGKYEVLSTGPDGQDGTADDVSLGAGR